MPMVPWKARVVDCPVSDPWTEVGDLLVAIRTPRSRDFVTVEVGPRSGCDPLTRSTTWVASVPAPRPLMSNAWSGEVSVGRSVHFSLGTSEYELTLAKLEEAEEGLPWIVCEFVIEHR